MLRTTLAAVSVIAIAACGGDQSDNAGQSTIPSTTTTTSTATVTDTASGTLGANIATSGVASFDAADRAFNEKRYGEAVTLFDTYVGQHPQNAWGHYMLGLSSWKSGDLVKARGSFERALELDPKHVKSVLNLGRVLIELGDPAGARKHVLVAVSLDGKSADAHRLLGRVQSELKQHEEAIGSYRTALSLNPGDAWSMNNMALIMIQQRRFEEAIPPLARAVQIDSTVAVFQNNLGVALEHIGQYTLATRAYRSAVAADPTYSKAVMSLTRVDGRKEDSTLVPMDLVAVAKDFDSKLRTGEQVVGTIGKVPNDR